jgi:hypothetical protein
MHASPLSRAAAHWLAFTPRNEPIFRCAAPLTALADTFFRGQKTSCSALSRKIVRTRIETELLRNQTFLTVYLEASDMPWSAWITALQMADADWIAANWRALAAVTDVRLLAAAMATDGRDTIRRRGAKLLRRGTGLWEKWLPAADTHPMLPAECQAWREILHHAQANPSDHQNAIEDSGQLEKVKASLEKEMTKLRASRQQQKERADRAEESLLKLKQETAREQAANRREYRDLRNAYQQLQTTFDQAVEARIQGYRRELFGLSPEQQAAARCEDDGPLLRKVEQVVHAHAQINARYGTLSELRTRIQKLEQAEQQLRDCRAESINVLPQLDEIQTQLQDELARLRQLLPETAARATDPAVSRLLELIRTASPDTTGIAALQELQTFLASGTCAHLLSARQADTLRAELKRKHQHITSLEKERQLAKTVPDITGSDGQKNNLPAEIWNIQESIKARRKDTVRLIIDAYNIILGKADAGGLENHSIDLESERRHFLGLCEKKASLFGSVEIVFDGKGTVRTHEHIGDNITAVFAARQGESQNADNCIVQMLSEKHTAETVIWLATDDWELRQRAEKYCEAFVSNVALRQFLVY